MENRIKLEHGIEPTILDWYNDGYHRDVRRANYEFIYESHMNRLFTGAVYIEVSAGWDKLKQILSLYKVKSLRKETFDYSTSDRSIIYKETWEIFQFPIQGLEKGYFAVITREESNSIHINFIGTNRILDILQVDKINQPMEESIDIPKLPKTESDVVSFLKYIEDNRFTTKDIKKEFYQDDLTACKNILDEIGHSYKLKVKGKGIRIFPANKCNGYALNHLRSIIPLWGGHGDVKHMEFSYESNCEGGYDYYDYYIAYIYPSRDLLKDIKSISNEKDRAMLLKSKLDFNPIEGVTENSKSSSELFNLINFQSSNIKLDELIKYHRLGAITCMVWDDTLYVFAPMKGIDLNNYASELGKLGEVTIEAPGIAVIKVTPKMANKLKAYNQRYAYSLEQSSADLSCYAMLKLLGLKINARDNSIMRLTWEDFIGYDKYENMSMESFHYNSYTGLNEFGRTLYYDDLRVSMKAVKSFKELVQRI